MRMSGFQGDRAGLSAFPNKEKLGLILRKRDVDLPSSFTDHVIEEKKGFVDGGQLKNKDKGDGDQITLNFGTVDSGKKCGIRESKEKAMNPSSSNVNVDFEIRSCLDCGEACKESVSGEDSNTVDLLMGQEEIVKAGWVESPPEDFSKALMSGEGPTSGNSKALMDRFLSFDEGVLRGPSDPLLGDMFGEKISDKAVGGGPLFFCFAVVAVAMLCFALFFLVGCWGSGASCCMGAVRFCVFC
ncbi:hypothetical protein Q3G72_029401 [Acer saccharum]|nr:hypothetical protein Q3G72_029401 [Acer saccharum]